MTTSHVISQDVFLGGTKRFDCVITGRPRPSVQWYKVGEAFEMHHLDQRPCQTSPLMITSHITSQDVFVGGTTRFDCVVTGRPRPSVKWYKVGEACIIFSKIEFLRSKAKYIHISAYFLF